MCSIPVQAAIQFFVGPLYSKIEICCLPACKAAASYKMNARELDFEILQTMASRMQKLGVHDYDTLKTVQDWHNLEWDARKLAAKRAIELGLFKPRHGEGFQWICFSYRNSDLMFWHDEKGILYPYGGIDDYGSVPPEFRVGNGPKDFLPDHWDGVVEHNNIIFLSDDLVEEVKAALTSPQAKKNKGATSVLVEIKGYPYKIIVEDNYQFKGLPWATIDHTIIRFQHW